MIPKDYSDVIVVVNDNSQISIDITNYFKTRRNIPDSRIVHISTSNSETIDVSTFMTEIRTPIENFITSNNITNSINYIVTTKGVPLRFTDPADTNRRRSVDSVLTLMLGPYAGEIGSSHPYGVENPYKISAVTDDCDMKDGVITCRKEKFSRVKFGFYLVTRLTGYFYEDVKNMIDKAEISTNDGVFVLDTDPTKGGGYDNFNNAMSLFAKPLLEHKGYTVILDETTTYLTNQKNVLGYCSWGSNDANDTDHGKPHNTWNPGAIAETAVSSSGRTFEYPPTYGQSLIADLIAEGVTGAKGYVYEPLLYAIANPYMLFDAYTDQYNLAESFYMSSRWIGWRDVVVGDPKTYIAPPSSSSTLKYATIAGLLVLGYFISKKNKK